MKDEEEKKVVFVGKITSGRRIVIPQQICRKLGLKEGDIIALKVLKKIWDADTEEV